MLPGLVLSATLELAIFATGCLLVLLAGMVLVEMYRAHQTYVDFKRKTRGLPMIGNRSLISNHTISWALRKNMLNDVIAFTRERGITTYGWIVSNKFGATTLDPDLMKRIVLDEPNKNINKLLIEAPTEEFVVDSIMMASDDQWRRLRRAVAPALR